VTETEHKIFWLGMLIVFAIMAVTEMGYIPQYHPTTSFPLLKMPKTFSNINKSRTDEPRNANPRGIDISQKYGEVIINMRNSEWYKLSEKEGL
jgi:hypothetical protein